MIPTLLRWLWMMAGWCELTVLTAILYPLAWLPARRFGHPACRGLFRIWCRAWIDALGISLHLHQHNRRPRPRQYILLANHPSAFEDVGIPALFPVHSLAKIEVRRWPIVGRISAAAGTLYVDRESRDARRRVRKEILDALKQGLNVAVYPEGGIHGKRLHERFHRGIFELSMDSGVPVLPVFLQYEAQDDFHWSHEPLPRKLLDFMTSVNHHVHYHLHDAIHPDAFDDARTYCDHVYQHFLNWQERYL